MRLLNNLAVTIVSLVFMMPLAAAENQAGGQIKWFDDYSKAVAEAKASNKPLLLFFTGSDWCGWCKKMDTEVFSTPEFAKAVGSTFVFVDLDFPMNKQLPENIASQNAALKKKFSISGFPTIIVLDAQENFIAESGYRAGGGQAYAQYLKELL